jgi:creatinine deaminase
MDPFLQAAIEEAKKGLAAGGIPIGSVLVLDGKIMAAATTNACNTAA